MPLPRDEELMEASNQPLSIPEQITERLRNLDRRAKIFGTSAIGGLVGLPGDTESLGRAGINLVARPFTGRNIVPPKTILPDAEKVKETIREAGYSDTPEGELEQALDFFGTIAGSVLLTRGAGTGIRATKKIIDAPKSIKGLTLATKEAVKVASPAVKSALKWAGFATAVEKGGEAINVPPAVRAAAMIALPFASNKLRRGLKSGAYKNTEAFAAAEKARNYKARNAFKAPLNEAARQVYDSGIDQVNIDLNQISNNAVNPSIRGLANKIKEQLVADRYAFRGESFRPNKLLSSLNRISDDVKGFKKDFIALDTGGNFALSEVKGIEGAKRNLDSLVKRTLTAGDKAQAWEYHVKGNEANAFEQDLKNITKNIQQATSKKDFSLEGIGTLVGAVLGGDIVGAAKGLLGGIVFKGLGKGIQKLKEPKRIATAVSSSRAFNNIIKNDSLQEASIQLIERLSQPDLSPESVITAVRSYINVTNNFKGTSKPRKKKEGLLSDRKTILNRLIEERSRATK